MGHVGATALCDDLLSLSTAELHDIADLLGTGWAQNDAGQTIIISPAIGGSLLNTLCHDSLGAKQLI